VVYVLGVSKRLGAMCFYMGLALRLIIHVHVCTHVKTSNRKSHCDISYVYLYLV